MVDPQAVYTKEMPRDGAEQVTKTSHVTKGLGLFQVLSVRPPGSREGLETEFRCVASYSSL